MSKPSVVIVGETRVIEPCAAFERCQAEHVDMAAWPGRGHPGLVVGVRSGSRLVIKLDETFECTVDAPLDRCELERKS